MHIKRILCKSIDCYTCQKEHDMPLRFCCLYECGEHDFCKKCKCGIYLKEGEKSMKYIIDLDSLKDCLDFIKKPIENEQELVSLNDVKSFIDSFPKEKVSPDLTGIALPRNIH